MNKKINYQKILYIPLMVCIIILFSSCYSDYGLTEEDYDIVITLYDTTADFGSYKTFIIPDSVVQLGGSSITSAYNETILNTFINQMESRGYTRIYPNDTARADLIALASVTTTQNYVYTDYWSYWGWYGWGGYYPYGGYGYYPYYTSYTFTTGTVFMNLIDVAKSDTTNKKIASVWLGALNGVTQYSNVSNRIINGISQAFTQSPYLRTY